jgi:biotin operon repressor
MTMFEKLTLVLSDGNWHSAEELVQRVGHRFSATIHTAIKQRGCKIEKRRDVGNKFEYRMLVVKSVVG